MGFGSDKEDELLQYFKNKFETNELWSKEKEKTQEQRELIERVNHELHDFLSQYGIDALEVSAENIHLLDKTRFTKEELAKMQREIGTEHGFYSAPEQCVVLMKDYDESKLSFIQTLVHELLHLQGFYSYQKSTQETADLTLHKDTETASMNIRRSGFSIGTKDGKQLLFHKLNESVITEIGIRFEEACVTRWPEVQTELDAKNAYIEYVAERDGVPIDVVRKNTARIKGDKDSGYTWVSYGYHKERQQLNFLIDRLYEKNEEHFESREDVFKLFADATMNGKLLPVARLIERTYGKGSFREVGERSADKPSSEVLS